MRGIRTQGVIRSRVGVPQMSRDGVTWRDKRPGCEGTVGLGMLKDHEKTEKAYSLTE